MVAMLASDTPAFLAALERGQVLVWSGLLGVAGSCAGVGGDVTIRLSVELISRLAILRVDVKRLLKTLVRLVMVGKQVLKLLLLHLLLL